MRIQSRLGGPRLAAVVASLAAVALVLVASPSRIAAQEAEARGKQAVITVKGMQCPFCAYGIQKQLKKLPGATKVEVELAKNQAVVSFTPDADVTDEQIQKAVRKAGFTAAKIEWRTAGQSAARPPNQD